MSEIKVGDIIDGKRVIKVYWLCGGMAYQTEPVKSALIDETEKNVLVEEPVKKRGRKKA